MIYFITAKNHVKIGYSANPEQRLKELQTGNPIKLKLMVTLPGSYETEKALHDYFSRNRREGEWFHYTGELKNVVLGNLWTKRKHEKPINLKQFLENGLHYQLSQKAKRNGKLAKRIARHSA